MGCFCSLLGGVFGSVDAFVGCVVAWGVTNLTLLGGVLLSMVPCVGVTAVDCGTPTGIVDCTGIVEGENVGSVAGALLGVNRSPGELDLVKVYSLDGDSDLTKEKGGSGSPLSVVSSSGKWLVMVPNIQLHSSELKSGRS